MRFHKSIFAVVLACASLAAIAPAVPADEAAAPSGVKAEMLMWIKDAEGKLIQLAEATPESKYAYRPGKGVRSTGEVFMHVAGANFGIPGLLGVAPPAGFNIQTYESSLTKKADIVKALKDSFQHMETALANASDADLDKPAEFFGLKTTVRGAYLLLLSHSHEHLGQSIAYARVNGMVPPWTAKEQAAAAAKETEAKAKSESK